MLDENWMTVFHIYLLLLRVLSSYAKSSLLIFNHILIFVLMHGDVSGSLSRNYSIEDDRIFP